MAKSHRKSKATKESKAKKESKTDKLNRIGRELGRIQEKLDEINKTIAYLEPQYDADATSRRAYQKATYDELSAAYDKRYTLNTELQQKQDEYNAVEAELESSSDDESKKSGDSGSSGGGHGSSGSSAPAIMGWDCGACGEGNFNDPWGLDNTCACGHQFCGNDNHCMAQWNP
jgi:hypothetical protein